MNRSRNLVRICIAGIILTGCGSQQTHLPSGQHALADSLIVYFGKTINPLFHDHQLSRSRAILDSLGPIVAHYDHYPLTCTYWRFKGVQYLMEEKTDSALNYIRQSLALATQKDSTQKHVIAAKTQLAGVYIDKKQYDSALIYARDAYSLAKKLDTNGLPMICLKLSGIYTEIEDMEARRKYLFEGFHASANNPKYKMAFATNIGKYYDDNKQLDSSVLFFKTFVEKDTSFSNPYIDAVKYENLGILLTKQGKLEEGLQYQLKALAINKELGQLDAESLFNTGVTYSKLQQFQTAEGYLDDAFAQAKEEEDQTTITKVWKRKAVNYAQQHRYQEAYAASDSSNASFETEVNASLTAKARELETQYQVKAKDDEISSLGFANTANRKISRQQEIIIISLAGTFILLAVLGIVWWRRRKLGELLRQTQLEQRLLRSQMEPHFIFNTLSVLQSFIRNNEKEKAIRYLNQFARLLRVSLENARESFVPLKDEISALENYLSLQAMRFEGLFDYHIDVYALYEEEDLLIPPMLLQPFVENAILHGMKQLNYKGQINISISRELHVLQCVIDDNGSGLQQQAVQQQRISLSTIITQERLTILSRQTRQPASLTIIDKRKEQQQGTRVILQIPFRKAAPFSGSGKTPNGF